MASVVSEEVRTFFTGDASGIEAAGKKTEAVLDSQARKEKIVTEKAS